MTLYLNILYIVYYTVLVFDFGQTWLALRVSPLRRLSSSDPVSVLCLSECARLFHEGGARLVLCGPSWDKLESLYDSLCGGSDPSKVSIKPHYQTYQRQKPSTSLSHVHCDPSLSSLSGFSYSLCVSVCVSSSVMNKGRISSWQPNVHKSLILVLCCWLHLFYHNHTAMRNVAFVFFGY